MLVDGGILTLWDDPPRASLFGWLVGPKLRLTCGKIALRLSCQSGRASDTHGFTALAAVVGSGASDSSSAAKEYLTKGNT